MKILFLVLFFLISCGGSDSENIIYTNSGNEEAVWNFSDPNNYSYNTNYVEISSGKAILKEVDTNHSGSDFNSGSHMGTELLNSKITLKEKPTASETHVNTIVPGKSGNLIGYWRFDGNLNDSSGNNHTGVSGGSFSLSVLDSKLGGGSGRFEGDGSSSEVGVGDFMSINQDSSFSTSAWVKYETDGIANIVRVQGGGNVLSCRIFTTSNEVNFQYGSTLGTLFSLSAPIDVALQSQWNLISCVKNEANNTSSIYINGALVASSSDIVGNWDTSGIDIKLGKLATGNETLRGNLDDVSIWNEALTEEEVFDLYSAQNANYTELNSSWTPQYSSIVAYWKMDGNWQDSSGNGNHGTAINDSSTTTSSKIGSGAGSFDGDDDYISVTDTASLNMTSDVSVSLWLKTTSNAISVPIGKYTGPGLDRGWVIVHDAAGLVSFAGRDGSGIYHTSGNSSGSVNDNEWHHVVGKRSGSIWSIYLDGVLASSADGGTSGDLSNNLNLTIGVTNNSLQFDFYGKIDDVAIWNRSLSATEVSLIYNRQKQKYAGSYESPIIDTGFTSTSWTAKSWITDLPFMKELPGSAGSESSADYSLLVGSTGLTSDNDLMNGLVGLWHLNGVSTPNDNDVVLDSSGNDHNGLINDADIVNNISFKASLFDSGVYFNGEDEYIEISDHSDLKPLLFSVSLWFRTTQTGNVILLEKDQLNGFSIQRRSGAGVLAMNINSGFVNSQNTYNDGKWHHLVIIYRGNNDASLYVDGVDDTAIPVTVNPPTFSSGNLFIGSREGAIPYKGMMDEIAIWSRALNPDEVKQLYRRGANRVKVQIRSCDDASCSGEEWQGPDNANGKFYFSELNNCNLLLPSGSCDYTGGGLVNLESPNFNFTDFLGLAAPNNQYFQYKILMESDDDSFFPSLTSLNLGSTKYFGGSPDIITTTGQKISKWSGFDVDVLGNCTPTYQVSIDKLSWHYHDGTSWVAAAIASDSNNEATINAHTSSFFNDVGVGDIYLKIFLNSNTTEDCIIDRIRLK